VSPARAEGEVSARALRLHRAATVVDTHIDTPQRILLEKVDIGRRLPDGHLDIPRMREGGLDALFFSIWVDSPFAGAAAVKRALQLIDAVDRTVAANPKDLALATSAGGLERAVRAGKIAALMGIEGGHAIADDLGVLRLYRKLGVSYMTLTWANPTSWADSSGKEGRDRVKAPDGLSDFGREVVREMNRIGMIVDVSHVSDRTFQDVLAVSTRPVIASHSSCRALLDVPRNMTDDMIRALAKNGGVIGINYGSGFLDGDYRKRSEAIRQPGGLQPPASLGSDPEAQALWRYRKMSQAQAGSGPRAEPPPLSRLIDHIDHAARVGGVDHVGLGSDFDGVSSLPRGMEDVSRLPHITEALLARGYSEKDIRKILGGNFLRVLRAVTGE
jgi:membrane dipeptidase